jgi:hypothetical protein
VLPIGTRCIFISLYYTENKIQIGGEYFAAFFLFMGTLPKDCALLGGNENTLKIKTTAKLNSKQTSIATVLDLY